MTTTSSSKMLKPKEIMKIINYFLLDRRQWKIIGWNSGAGEINVVRYEDIDEKKHVAKVTHIWSEMREDMTFGLFERVLHDIIKQKSFELIVVFKRPGSPVIMLYRISRRVMDKTVNLWGTGKSGQYQIPIKFFEKLDEFLM